jgi:hypothetical protein
MLMIENLGMVPTPEQVGKNYIAINIKHRNNTEFDQDFLRYCLKLRTISASEMIAYFFLKS